MGGIVFNPGTPPNDGITDAVNGLHDVVLAGVKTVALGGPLLENTQIDLTNHFLYINGNDGAGSVFTFILGSLVEGMDFSVFNAGTGNGGGIGFSTAEAKIGCQTSPATVLTLDAQNASGWILTDSIFSRGITNKVNYEDQLQPNTLMPVNYLTPLPVNDTLGIFTNADCEAAAPFALPGKQLIGTTVMYTKTSAGTWINYAYTACL